MNFFKFSRFPSKGFGGFSLTSLILESWSFMITSAISRTGSKSGDWGIWNGLYGSGRGSKGVQPAAENEADRSSFVLGSDSFGSSGGPSTCLGSGELLLSCVLAPLGSSSASLYSDVSVSVSGQSLANERFPFVFATCLFRFKCVECCDSVSTISEKLELLLRLRISW